MNNTLYIGLSHQMAMRRQMDVIANNIANMNTFAFKNESVLFKEHVVDTDPATPDIGNQVAFVLDFGVLRNQAEGRMEATTAPLDIAISGKGYLQVQGDNGEIFYTRNGHFRVREDGVLVNTKGYKVLDTFGAEIRFDPDDAKITIAKDGTITTSNGRRGRFGVVAFAEEQGFENMGDSMFRTDQEPVPNEGATILQGFIEASNVEPIIEMSKMVDLLRSYEGTAKLLQTYEELQRQSIQSIAKVA